MRTSRGAAAAVLILAMAALPLSGLEIATEALAGNLFFPWNQAAATVGAFPADNLFWGLGVSVSDTVGDGVSYDIGYRTDPVLRHLVSVLLTYDVGFAQFSAGPFLGAFNSREVPLKGGLSTSLRLEWPGKLFASFRSDSSLGGGLLAAGDYIQEATEISAGWYVYNAICTLSMLTKTFYIQETAALQTQDRLARYAFDVNVYRKGAPLTLVWTLGYQTLSKTWDDGTPETDTLGSVILGTRVDWRAGRKLRLTARLETSVFTFAVEGPGMTSPDQASFLFDAGLGIIYKLGGGVTGSAPSAP